MILLRKAKKTVEGALDRLMANRDWAASRPLQKDGVKLSIVPKKGTGVGKLHHKLMVIDEQVIIAGSFNYTKPANRVNDETSSSLATSIPRTKRRSIGKRSWRSSQLNEIRRLTRDHGEPMPQGS